MDWKHLHKLIGSARRILLTSHENPDGDGLGSAAALYHYLQALHKEVRILIPSACPPEYAFLDQGIFEKFSLELHGDWLRSVDLAIVLDVGDYRRLRMLGEELGKLGIPVMNIDHHSQVENLFFTYNLVDMEAAATGEILYNYFLAAGATLTPEICTGLYTAVLTDTGSFRYNNTNERCHEIAIVCIRQGIDPHRIYKQVYENNSHERVRLLGRILVNLHYEENGELAWFLIDKKLLSEAQARLEDVDGFTDFVRTIKGVEVALMILENGHNSCRINMRSKGKYVVHKIAQSFQGGGHPFAAGAIVDGRVEAVTRQVVETTRHSMRSQRQQESP